MFILQTQTLMALGHSYTQWTHALFVEAVLANCAKSKNLRNIQMCSYFFLLILVNQLELINSLIKPPIKTHPMTCFKFLRKRSEWYSLYSSKCCSLFTNRHNNSYDLLKTALKNHKNGHISVKNYFFQKISKTLFRS